MGGMIKGVKTTQDNEKGERRWQSILISRGLTNVSSFRAQKKTVDSDFIL
jgi:hypothetical protein